MRRILLEENQHAKILLFQARKRGFSFCEKNIVVLFKYNGVIVKRIFILAKQKYHSNINYRFETCKYLGFLFVISTYIHYQNYLLFRNIQLLICHIDLRQKFWPNYYYTQVNSIGIVYFHSNVFECLKHLLLDMYFLQ